MDSAYIKSPLNYTGGKYKLLPHILPRFPERIGTFVDLFAGGLNVGINTAADTIYANDQITYLIELYRYFQQTPVDRLLEAVHDRIRAFDLSLTNGEGYRKLRLQYNRDKDVLDLFLLTCYSFNHQIRFNSRHEFNTPFGKERSAYNDSIEANLIRFCAALQEKRIVLSAADFRAFDWPDMGADALVYCDPPYLITTGSYNDGKRGFRDWTGEEERALLDLLDRLDRQGVRFVLSNVTRHKGMVNDLLLDWSRKYHTVYLDKHYANCSYHVKDRTAETVEVLVMNYETACLPPGRAAERAVVHTSAPGMGGRR